MRYLKRGEWWVFSNRMFYVLKPTLSSTRLYFSMTLNSGFFSFDEEKVRISQFGDKIEKSHNSEEDFFLLA